MPVWADGRRIKNQEHVPILGFSSSGDNLAQEFEVVSPLDTKTQTWHHTRWFLYGSRPVNAKLKMWMQDLGFVILYNYISIKNKKRFQILVNSPMA